MKVFSGLYMQILKLGKKFPFVYYKILFIQKIYLYAKDHSYGTSTKIKEYQRYRTLQFFEELPNNIPILNKQSIKSYCQLYILNILEELTEIEKESERKESSKNI